MRPFALAIAVVGLAFPARAALLSGANVTVAPHEVINGNLYARGGTVTIHGVVVGDAVVGASKVVIDGYVVGDVLVGAGTVTITGRVEGDVRSFGGDITLHGPVGGDVTITGGTLNILGPIGGDALLAGGETRVASVVAGDLIATGGKLRLERGAVVHGDVQYAGDRFERATGAVVLGQVIEMQSNIAAMRGTGIMGWLQTVIGMCLFGLLWLSLFRDFAHRAFDTLRTRPGMSFGVGAAVFFGAPIVLSLALVVGALVGGWWISLFGFAIYVMALVVTIPLVAAFLGRRFFGHREIHEGGPMFLFIVIFSLLMAIPIVGGIVAVAIMLFGLGAIAMTFVSRMRPLGVESAGGSP